MNSETIKQTREKVLSLIESEFESDAAFEREMGLQSKTVNNWRRERSSSFMKMLPKLAEGFEVSVGELLAMPITHDTSELSEDEIDDGVHRARTRSPKIEAGRNIQEPAGKQRIIVQKRKNKQNQQQNIERETAFART